MDINKALQFVLENEGGFQNEVNDWANWNGGKQTMDKYLSTKDETLLVNLVGTKYGITAQDLPGVNLKDLTPEQAMNFYLTSPKEFVGKLYSKIESQEVGTKLIDLGVLFGPGMAIRVLQLILKLDMDGIFGPVTLGDVNSVDETSLLGVYKAGFVTHAIEIAKTNPLERPNLVGWIRRINL